VGTALGAARLARLAHGGERVEQVCVAPPIERVVQPDAALSALLATRRRMFVRLYQDLRNDFRDFSA
jgi:xylulokinase